MKTEFELDGNGVYTENGIIKIIRLPPDYLPYVSVSLKSVNGVELSACIPDKDVEDFAVNILKALKSKKITLMKTEMEDESDPVYEVGKNKDDASKGKYELWQTSNPNKPRYFMSTNITTDAMDKRWLELWGEIENWYGDFTKKETGEQFWKRMQEKFNLIRKPEIHSIHCPAYTTEPKLYTKDLDLYIDSLQSRITELEAEIRHKDIAIREIIETANQRHNHIQAVEEENDRLRDNAREIAGEAWEAANKWQRACITEGYAVAKTTTPYKEKYLNQIF